jgi:drug/metabolite transporter (DMT)-like permease
VTRRAIILFAALGIAWGIPYLLIKVAVGELEPSMVVLGRSAIGAVLLLPIAIFRKQLIPVFRRWKPLLAYTVVEIVVPWFFLSTAEQRLPSSTAGLLLAAIPVVGVGVAIVMGRPARLTAANWVGILLGTLGVAALVGLDVAGSDLIGVAQLAVVVVGYAFGPAILSRWMSDLPGIGVVAASLAIAAVIYVPVVSFTGGWPTEVPSVEVIWSVVALGVVCSALAFLLMFALIAEIGPMRMTTITYVNPAVAIVAGALILGETVTIVTVIGFALVLGGSYLVTRKRAAEIPPDPEAAPAVVDAQAEAAAEADAHAAAEAASDAAAERDQKRS